MSVLRFNKSGRSSVSDVPQKTQPNTGVSENLSSGISGVFALSPMKSTFYEKKWWAGVVDQIEQQTGETFKNPINPLLERGGTYYDLKAQEIRKHFKENQETLRMGHPDEPGGSNLLTLDNDTFARTINNLAREDSKKDRAEADEVYSRAGSTTAKAAHHLGGFIGSAADPLNLTISLALGPFSIATTGLARTMFREAMINMTAEVIQQPAVKDWYESLGMEYTFGDFRNAVLSAGAIGAGFPVVIKGAKGTIKLTAEQMKKGSEIIFGAGGKKSDVAKGAEIALNAKLTEVAENPLEGPKAELEHKTRTLEAVDASGNNTAPAISEAPATQVKTPESIYDSDNLDGQVFRFNPDEINVDAKLFQFKEGGDEFGVTNRFKGVTQWDPSKAGQIVVYEYADGRQFIADGHQRLGLAKKIKAADPSQDVRLYGSKLREVDGVTEDAAVVIAAMKNIGEGTGTKTDAAKVFRLAPEKFDDPSFPKTGAFIEQARALANLADESFGLVKNGIVSEEFGALVGRLVPDNADMQLAAMNVLAKVGPSNAFQAESIIRQVMDIGVTRETQQTLFGDEVLAESLFLERAKVLDAAQKQLRKDKAAFSNITKNASKLEGEGNQLAADANQKRLLEDGTAIALLQSQANKKGALSDALTDAARLAKDTGKYGQATTSFVEAVRRSIDSGDFEGPGAGDVGRAFNDQAEEFSPRNDVEQSHLEDFDNPNSDAVASQTDAMVADMRAEYNLDMFDQGAKSAPGDRQMDLEQLIAEDVQAADSAMTDAIQTAKDKIEPDWRPYMTLEDGDTLVPIANIKPVKVRPEGVVNAIPFMEQGAKGEIPKRGALLLRANADGSYSIRDGNSTFTIAEAAGWAEMPSKIITDAQYATELSRKAADRILNQDALKKKKLRYVSGEDLGKDETDIFVEALQSRQNFASGEDVLAAAIPNHKALNEAAGKAADDLGIDFKRDIFVKDLDRINEKTIDKYGGDYRQMTDAARTGINVATMKEADDFVKAMEKQFHLLDEGWFVTPVGYFDRKIMVIFDDKTLGEIQIWPPKMLNAKQEPTLHAKSGHDYYEISRSADATPEAKADADAKMIEIYGAVTSTLDSSFATKLGVGAPRAKSADLASPSVSSTDPSSVTTSLARAADPPTGVQALSSDQIIPSDPSIAATLPKSNLKNLTAIDDDLFSTPNISDLRANIKNDLLDEEFPVGFAEDPDTGEAIARTVTARQLFDEIAQEDAMVERLSRCPI